MLLMVAIIDWSVSIEVSMFNLLEELWLSGLTLSDS